MIPYTLRVEYCQPPHTRPADIVRIVHDWPNVLSHKCGKLGELIITELGNPGAKVIVAPGQWRWAAPREKCGVTRETA